MRYHARWVLPITQPPIENGTGKKHERFPFERGF